MVQQIQFISLTQAEYDGLSSTLPNRLYFTSDTHRIYKGSDLYATTEFDELEFEDLEAKTLKVDGKDVSLEGHTHGPEDIVGLDEIEFDQIEANSIKVAGKDVSLDGHTHTMGDITDFEVATQVVMKVPSQNINMSMSTLTINKLTESEYNALQSVSGGIKQDELYFVDTTKVDAGSHPITNVGTPIASTDAATKGYVDGLNNSLTSIVNAHSTTLSGITQTSITKDIGTFTSLTVGGNGLASIGHTHSINDITDMNEVELHVSAIEATGITVDGKNVSLEDHTHAIGDVDELQDRLDSIDEELEQRKPTKWYTGSSGIYGTQETPRTFPNSTIEYANEGDIYLATNSADRGRLYKCHTPGDPSTATWEYIGTILGQTGDRGAQGVKGDQGERGLTGPTGKDGTRIYTGDQVSGDDVVNVTLDGIQVGDLYLNSSGQLYECTSQGSIALEEGDVWTEDFEGITANQPLENYNKAGTWTWNQGSHQIRYTADSASVRGYSDSLAGGQSPELIMPGNTSFTVNGLNIGGARVLKLDVKTNRNGYVGPVDSDSYTSTQIEQGGNSYLITPIGSPEEIDLQIKNWSSSNSRVDDIKLSIYTAGQSTAQTWELVAEFSNKNHTHTRTDIVDFTHNHEMNEITGLIEELDSIKFNEEEIFITEED